VVADERQVKALAQRLHAASITSLGEAQIHCALSMHPDDIDKAYEALLLANDAFEGTITEYDPNVKMLGAVNRNMVTCYLDALLFAMFARLDSFEAMLSDNFNDEPRKKLAAILRLWVNFLRTGRLIGVEFVRLLDGPIPLCLSLTCSCRPNTCKVRWPSAAGRKPPKCASKTLQRPSPS
jgi:hypothetical protein